MLSCISSHFNKQELSDVKIKIGNTTIFAHKFILAAQSPVFKNIFFNKQFSDSRKQELEIKDFSSEAFISVIRCLYNEKVEISPSFVLEALAIADRYDLQRIKTGIVQFIIQNLTVTNVCSTLATASVFSKELESECINFINLNAEAVFEGENFLNLREEDMIRFLSNKNLDIDEIQLYKAMISWGIVNAETANKPVPKIVHKLIPLICYAAISPTELEEIVEAGKRFIVNILIFLDNIVSLSLLLEAHKFYSMNKTPTLGYWKRTASVAWENPASENIVIHGKQVVCVKSDDNEPIICLKNRVKDGRTYRFKIVNGGGYWSCIALGVVDFKAQRFKIKQAGAWFLLNEGRTSINGEVTGSSFNRIHELSFENNTIVEISWSNNELTFCCDSKQHTFTNVKGDLVPAVGLRRSQDTVEFLGSM